MIENRHGEASDRRSFIGKPRGRPETDRISSFLESWEVSSPFAVSVFRRINMSRARPFVKRVNTTYCASVLGQSQDVDEHGGFVQTLPHA
jgi:hypothetical protein